MLVAQERGEKIKQTMKHVRDLVDGNDINAAVLDDIKACLLELAQHKQLFTLKDFPPPDAGSDRNSCLYRLSEDDDHRFALYANVADGSVNAPPHDHTTWAVIVGVLGQEKNRFYSKQPSGVSVTGEKIVEDGTGIIFMPDDLHSIHIEEGAPVLNFHMYGLALEQLPGRNYWSAPQEKWKTFPAHTDIREARS